MSTPRASASAPRTSRAPRSRNSCPLNTSIGAGTFSGSSGSRVAVTSTRCSTLCLSGCTISTCTGWPCFTVSSYSTGTRLAEAARTSHFPAVTPENSKRPLLSVVVDMRSAPPCDRATFAPATLLPCASVPAPLTTLSAAALAAERRSSTNNRSTPRKLIPTPHSFARSSRAVYSLPQMFRAAALFLALCSVGSFAQSAELLPPLVQQRIDHHVRLYSELPPEATITFGALRPAELPGYRTLPVAITDQGKTRTADFLISADGKQMLYLSHFDLTADPYKEVMAKINLRGRPARAAAAGAPITVVVYDDFECPFCSKMYVTLFNLVMSEYRDRVRVIYKDFPISPETHPWSMRAAEDAGCLLAQKQEGYWVFADYIHTHLEQMNQKYAAAKASKSFATPFAPLDLAV